jgi:hypothetical protein
MVFLFFPPAQQTLQTHQHRHQPELRARARAFSDTCYNRLLDAVALASILWPESGKIAQRLQGHHGVCFVRDHELIDSCVLRVRRRAAATQSLINVSRQLSPSNCSPRWRKEQYRLKSICQVQQLRAACRSTSSIPTNRAAGRQPQHTPRSEKGDSRCQRGPPFDRCCSHTLAANS